MRNRTPLAAAALLTLLCAQPALAQDASQRRFPVALTSDWKFLKNAPPGAETADDKSWETVSVPHTWNARDGEDGGNNYFRGECVYRHPFVITNEQAGRTIYLRFHGVNQRATLYVNGTEVGKHDGGFSTFAFDVTATAHPGQNDLAVRVTNSQDKNVPPWDADFTFFGGIYREVELLLVDPVHISPLDYGSPGVSVTVSNIQQLQANATMRTLVRNASTAPATRIIETTILNAAGQPVSSEQTGVSVEPGKTETVTAAHVIANPHLWNGRKDPYLYTVRVRLIQDGKVLDEVTQPLGVRTFAVDAAKGFLLNGQPYDLHGVNRHQDRIDQGWAISNVEHDEDLAFIKEMGCTAVRLAHYQHAEHFYDLCDRNGIVAWAEIPVVNRLSTSDAFYENARQQYTELIRQNMNHPSIAFWSAGNEVLRNEPNIRGYFSQMNELAHKEDPSRLSALAERAEDPLPGIMDVYGLNEYFGWYTGSSSDLVPWLAKQPPKMAITEYGAGASIYYHSEKPVRMDHSEEYECLYHEAHWGVLSKHPEVWGKFIWNMFDFAVDSRKEGDHAGRNDKGLITYDRKTKKDAFFFYKANWSDEPTLHLTATRFAVRGIQQIPVKIYSNAPEVELFVNGKSLGKKTNTLATFLWENVTLNEGPNAVRAAATINGKQLEDTCSWTYTPGAPAEVDIPQDDTMAAELKKGPPRAPAR